MYARRETFRSFADFRERLVRTEIARSVRNTGTGARVRDFAREKRSVKFISVSTDRKMLLVSNSSRKAIFTSFFLNS